MKRFHHPTAVRLLAIALVSCLGLAACSGSETFSTTSNSTGTPSPSGGGAGGGGTGSTGGTGGSTVAAGVYNLSWSGVSDANVTGYRVYYSTTALTSSGTPGHLDVPLGTTSVDFSPGNYGMTTGSTLYMAVASYGAGGLESPLSSQVSVVLQ